MFKIGYILNLLSEIDKNEKIEYFFLCLSLILFWIFQTAIVSQLKITFPQWSDIIERIVFFLFFGFSHIFARSVLANLYNTQKAIIPFAPTATPKLNVLIGIGALLVALIFIITTV